MSINYRGTLFPLLQDYSEDFDPVRGYVFRYSFAGLSDSLMKAKQLDYVQAGVACRLTYHTSGRATLDVDDSTQQFTIDSWEIVGNEENVDGFSHPIMLANVAPNDFALLRADLDSNTSPTDLTTKLTQGGYSAPVAAAITAFYSLQQRGSSEYRRGQYVLRHTTNVPNGWASNVSDVGVDTVYTPAQLLSEVQSTALWIFPLPGRLVYKISNIPVPVAIANYQWGWLKSSSTETTSVNNRISIQTDYTLEQWSIQPNGYYAIH